MTKTENLPPHSLGLWGDGDEVAAIRDVERRFDVQLDYSDARNWVTVGDVFTALQRALPAEEAKGAGTWLVFAEAISAETGVNPTKVSPQTVLLGAKHFSWRVSVAVAVVAGLVLALIFHS